MRAHKATWALLGAGLLVPIVFLSVTSYRRLQEGIRARERIQAAELERGFRDRVRSTRRLLDRSLEDRISEALSRIPAGEREPPLVIDPILAHPFTLDPEGRVLFPPSLPSPDPEIPDGVWRTRIREAAALEARSPGEPSAVSACQDALARSPDRGVTRQAALLLGAWHVRAGRLVEALEAYEKGWGLRPPHADPETALLGAMRVVCLARTGSPEGAAAATASFLEAVLSVDAWGDPAEAAPLVRIVSDLRPPRRDLSRREARLWEEWDHLPARLVLRRVLSDWGLQAIASRPEKDGLLLVSRMSGDGARAIAFRPAGPGISGAGALLDVPRVEAWLAERLATDAGPGAWRLVPADAAAGASAGIREPIPSRIPLWRLEAEPPAPAAGGHAGGGEEQAGRALLLASVAVAAVSFALILWALSRERELQRMKGEFISAASHELRTPLALIQTAGETLHLGRVNDPDRVKGYLAVIDRESRRLARLMANLLDFSRLEAGRRPWTPRRIDTTPFLREALAELREAFADPAIAWEVSVPDALPPLAADPEALRMVLANLVGNAVKYSPGDAKRVIVSAGAEGGKVRLDVEDRGIGIPAAERARVFERFYRTDAARGIPGSGIGLSLVRQAVEAHGGSVEALGASPNGTLFRILLPVFPVSAEAGVNP